MVHLTKTFSSLLLLSIALIASANSHAQSYYGPDKNIRLGLTATPTIAWLNYADEAYDASPKLGFAYGLLADLGFARNYYFSTGLLINAINAKVTHGTTAKDIRLQYVDVPLSLKLKSNENEYGRFYGQFGLTAGVKVSAKEKFEGNKKQDLSGEDLFRLGLQIGGGMEWRLSNDIGVMTGLSYNNGFTRAIKDGAPKTSYIGLNLGLLF